MPLDPFMPFEPNPRPNPPVLFLHKQPLAMHHVGPLAHMHVHAIKQLIWPSLLQACLASLPPEPCVPIATFLALPHFTSPFNRGRAASMSGLLQVSAATRQNWPRSNEVLAMCLSVQA